MQKEKNIKTFSKADLEELRARGESRSDFARVDAKTDAELEGDIAADPDLSDVPANWQEAAKAVTPLPKKLLSLRLDADIVDWFKERGPGYQTRMNAVLRAFIEQAGKKRA